MSDGDKMMRLREEYELARRRLELAEARVQAARAKVTATRSLTRALRKAYRKGDMDRVLSLLGLTPADLGKMLMREPGSDD